MPDVRVESEHDDLADPAGDQTDHDRPDEALPGFDAERLEIQTGAIDRKSVV